MEFYYGSEWMGRAFRRVFAGQARDRWEASDGKRAARLSLRSKAGVAVVPPVIPLYSFDMPAKSIFEVLTDYHRSLENMKSWLAGRPPDPVRVVNPIDDAERIGIVDAWQEEMKEYFLRHGFCFGCNRLVSRCRCDEPL